MAIIDFSSKPINPTANSPIGIGRVGSGDNVSVIQYIDENHVYWTNSYGTKNIPLYNTTFVNKPQHFFITEGRYGYFLSSKITRSTFGSEGVVTTTVYATLYDFEQDRTDFKEVPIVFEAYSDGQTSDEGKVETKYVINLDTDTVDIINIVKFKTVLDVSIKTLYLANGDFNGDYHYRHGETDILEDSPFVTFNRSCLVNYGYGNVYDTAAKIYYFDTDDFTIKTRVDYNICKTEPNYNSYDGNTIKLVSTYMNNSYSSIIENEEFVYWFGGTFSPSSIFSFNKESNTIKQITGVNPSIGIPVGIFTEKIEDRFTKFYVNTYNFGFYSFSLTRWDNKYSIKNNDGSVTYIEEEYAPPLQGVRFRLNGSTVDYVLRSSYFNIEGSYETSITAGYALNGYAFKRNYKVPDIIINKLVRYTINEDAAFYEVFNIDNGIVLYSNSAEINRVNKSEYLEEIATLAGAFRDSTSVLEPSVTIEYSGVPNFNYAYIPKFNRYYFVNNITSIRTGLWEIDMEVDVLMTYNSAIINQTAFVDRNENDYNKMVNNSLMIPESKPIVYVDEIYNNIFNTGGPTDYLENTPMFVITGYGLGIEFEEVIT